MAGYVVLCVCARGRCEPRGIALSLSSLIFLRELLQQIVAVHKIVNSPLVDEIVAPGDLEKVVLLEARVAVGHLIGASQQFLGGQMRAALQAGLTLRVKQPNAPDRGLGATFAKAGKLLPKASCGQHERDEDHPHTIHSGTYWKKYKWTNGPPSEDRQRNCEAGKFPIVSYAGRDYNQNERSNKRSALPHASAAPLVLRTQFSRQIPREIRFHRISPVRQQAESQTQAAPELSSSGTSS